MNRMRLRSKSIREALQELSREIAELRGERDATREEWGLAKEAVALKKEIEQHKLERDRLTETHKREKREVEHMIGLEKKRAQFERESAYYTTIQPANTGGFVVPLYSTAHTNIFRVTPGGLSGVTAVKPQPDADIIDWLRSRVDEITELAFV